MDELDKFIKKQVEQHKTSTDADLLWQKIQAKQHDKKKKKRRFFLFWLLGGLGIFLLSVLLFFIPPADSSKTIASESPDSNIKTELSNSVLPEVSTPESGETAIGKSEVKKEEVKNSLLTGSLAKDKVSIKRTELKQNEVEASPLSEVSTMSSRNSMKKSGSDNTVIEPSLESENAPLPPDSEQNTSLETPEDITTVPESIKSDAEQDAGKTSSENSKEILADESNESDKKPTEDVSQIAEVPAAVLTDEPTPNDSTLAENSEPNISPQEKVKHLLFSTGLSVSYGKPLRTLSAKDAAGSDYLALRESSETPLDAVRITADFRMQFKNGFYLKSGVEYAQINERLDAYIERDSVETLADQVLVLAFARDGSSSETIGEGEVVTTYWTQKKIFNRYRSLDIPFLVGYQSDRKDRKLNWFAEGGVSGNFWFDARGRLFKAEDELLVIEETEDVFKRRTGFSLLAAAGATYRLSDKWVVEISPDFRYRLSAITEETNSLEQKYAQFGLRVGLRYHL